MGGGTPRVWVSFLGMDFSSQRGWGRELSSKLSRPCTYQPQSVVKIFGIRKSRLPAAILSDLLIPKRPFSRSFFLRVRVPKPVPVSGPVFRVGGGIFFAANRPGPERGPVSGPTSGPKNLSKKAAPGGQYLVEVDKLSSEVPPCKEVVAPHSSSFPFLLTVGRHGSPRYSHKFAERQAQLFRPPPRA